MVEKLSNKRIINKDILKIFLALAWPTVVAEFLATIVQYIDTAMVGNLGKNATATVSLSSTYAWLINSIIYAIGVGFLSYVARAMGEKREDKVKAAAAQAVPVVVVVGIITTTLAMCYAPFMPAVMGAEPGIRRAGAIYFALVNSPLLFRSAMIIFGSILRATGDTRTPMYINVFMNVLNTGLNYIFIYVLGIGAIGAGIATAISYVVGGILITGAFLRKPLLKFDRQQMRFNKPVMWSCLSVGIPVMFTQIASCSGYVVATSFVSAMPVAIYAAHSIAITAEELFYIPGYAMQAATSTLVGNSIGEKNDRKMRSVMLMALLTIFLLMCLSGVLLYLGAGFMMSLFTKDKEVIEIGTRLLRIVAFTEPIFGSAAVMEGIYDGMGRTRFPFVATLISRWGVRIMGSFIFIRVLGLGINEIWYCMIGDNILRALLLGAGLIKIVSSSKCGIKNNMQADR